MPSPTCSIVAPIFNESGNLPELYRRVQATMESSGETWELILIDDGSLDNSSDLILQLAAQDPRVRPVIFARNFGHQIAVTAGLDYSRGRAVIIIDSDLQDPPEVITDLIAKWREGYEVVYAIRAEREGESWFKKFTASMFYRLITRITDVKIPLDAGDFRLLDRKVVDVLNQMRVPYRRAARFAGETKYPFRKMFRLAINAITGFSYFPLQLATYIGFFAAGVSILSIPVVIGLRLWGGSQAPLVGQATTLIAVLFLGGVQLISLGILGEYIGRLYDEAKGRPLYIVREASRDTVAQKEDRGTA